MRCTNCGADLRRPDPIGRPTHWVDDEGEAGCSKNIQPIMEGLLHAKGVHIPNKPVSAYKVDVTIEGGRYDLLERDVWPDGVSPNSETGFWSAETLAASVGLEYGSAESFLASWSLEEDLTVTFTDDQGRSATVKFGR